MAPFCLGATRESAVVSTLAYDERRTSLRKPHAWILF
jgi:hypothetical protein